MIQALFLPTRNATTRPWMAFNGESDLVDVAEESVKTAPLPACARDEAGGLA
jgi:hypothetical protein